jgi:hypothetical protein
MENTPHETFANPSDNPDRIALEPALATPHFDEESIQNARPAVPLAQIKARRFWPLALVLMCGSTLLGAVIGIALTRYPKSSEQISTPTANVTPEVTSQSEPEELSQSAADSEDQPAVEANTEAKRAAGPRESREVRGEPISDRQNGDARTKLQGALDEWIAATNARDIQRQMGFYPQTVNAFYLQRNVPREAVRAEKSRVFRTADLIDIRAASPGIRLSPDGRTATMRFRKKYAIEGGDDDRRGEVLQELRWQRTADGWKIVSERDLRVIH